MAAIVPKYNLSVQSQAAPFVPQRIDTPIAAFGGATAKALENAGIQQQRNAEIIGRRALEIQKQNNEADALNAYNNFSDAERKFLYDPENGVYSKQGNNALKAMDEGMKFYEDQGKNWSDSLDNPQQKLLFKKMFDQRRDAGLDGISRHVAQERRTYMEQTAKSLNENNLNDSYVNWSEDEASFNKRFVETQKNVVAMLNAKGMTDPKTIRGELDKELSAQLAARLTGMVETGNPQNIMAAKAEYDRRITAGQLRDFETVRKLDNLFDAAVPKAAASNAYKELNGPMGMNVPVPDKIYDGIIMVESGGSQYDKAGMPLTSPKGAVGRAQIMPGTGPEAAKLAGLPWDETRFRLDPDYNTALGQAYFKFLNDRYNDKTLAVLAYNWGLGHLDKYIERVGDPRKGEISYSEFLARVPSDEARRYVPKVMAAVSDGRIDVSQANSKAQELEAKYPGAGQELLSVVDKHNEEIGKAEKQNQTNIVDQIKSVLQQSNGDISAVPAGLKAQALQAGVWDTATSFGGRSDENYVRELNTMTTDELMAVDFSDPAVRAKLSQTDLTAFVKQQTDMATNPENKRMSEKVDEMVNYVYAREMGVNTIGLGNSKKDMALKAKIERFKSIAKLELDAEYKRTKQVPDNDTIYKIVDGLLVNRSIDPPGLFNKVNNVFDLPLNKIPKDVRKQIEDGLVENGRQVTDANVLYAYRRYLLEQQNGQ